MIIKQNKFYFAIDQKSCLLMFQTLEQFYPLEEAGYDEPFEEEQSEQNTDIAGSVSSTSQV